MPEVLTPGHLGLHLVLHPQLPQVDLTGVPTPKVAVPQYDGLVTHSREDGTVGRFLTLLLFYERVGLETLGLFLVQEALELIFPKTSKLLISKLNPKLSLSSSIKSLEHIRTSLDRETTVEDNVLYIVSGVVTGEGTLGLKTS